MINVHKQAEKFILSQGKSAALRLYNAIEQLPLGDVKPLRGKKKPQLYRLRVGGYRIIFCTIEDGFTILRVDNRGDIYKRI